MLPLEVVTMRKQFEDAGSEVTAAMEADQTNSVFRVAEMRGQTLRALRPGADGQVECGEGVGPVAPPPGVRPGDVRLAGLHPHHPEAPPGELLPQVAQARAYVTNGQGLGHLVLNKLSETGYFVNLLYADSSLVIIADIIDFAVTTIMSGVNV